jgi:hypothetical protein
MLVDLMHRAFATFAVISSGHEAVHLQSAAAAAAAAAGGWGRQVV